jgi:hypothetical protein
VTSPETQHNPNGANKPDARLRTDEIAALTFSEAERNAMRAYLQRTEVRQSTLHRIGTAFISGAGLMLLIPIFFKDAITALVDVLIQQSDVLLPIGGTFVEWLPGLALYVLVGYPLLLSLGIPVYALLLLLKDIVHFYFTLYAPGFAATLHHPTFSMSAIAFSSDESARVKKEIMRYQYADAERMKYMIPFSDAKREEYFDHLIENTNGEIIPASRRLEKLQALEVLPENYDPQTVERFDTAMGIARALDRTLVAEVAYSEMAQVRNILYLRRLLLRYMKALLMFIWTMMVVFMMLPFLKSGRISPMLVMASGFLVWSVLAMPIVRQPLSWVYRHLHAMDKKQVDVQLMQLELYIEKPVWVAIGASAVALVLLVLM